MGKENSSMPRTLETAMGKENSSMPRTQKTAMDGKPGSKGGQSKYQANKRIQGAGIKKRKAAMRQAPERRCDGSHHGSKKAKYNNAPLQESVQV